MGDGTRGHKRSNDEDEIFQNIIKLFSCSTQLSIKFFLFINVKIVGILAFMNRKNRWHFNI